MLKDYQEVERIAQEITDVFFDAGARVSIIHYDTVVAALTTYGNARELQGVEKCIKLSDEIELREPDGGTKQWMAFKAFRNTMRDNINK
jgi:hypothetical protein